MQGSGGHLTLFGFVHLATIAVIVALACVLTGIARDEKFQRWVHPISAALAVILLSNEIIWWIVAVNLKLWSLQWGLPLQICDLVIFASAYSLIKHRQWVWELAYFWGLGGTLQAALTPDISFTFPHYYFLKFFITHGGVVVAVIFLAAGCGRPIRHSSIWRVFGITNIYAALVGILNWMTGANYLYLCAKPRHPSILDLLGPWPWYLLGLEAVLIISLYFYYLPFFLAARIKRHNFQRVMEYILKIIILFLLIKATMFGWRLSRPYTARLSEQEKSTAENLRKTVDHLAGVIGPRNYADHTKLDETADFIVRSFQELDYKVEVLPYTVQGRVFRNIIAYDSLAQNAGETVIIGAHYDSCFNPGADDNASGVAGLIELARLLKGARLASNLKFVAFTNEEPPFFMTEHMGSLVYARDVRAKGQKVKAAIILEMLGFYSERPFSQRYLPLLGPFYPNRANFVALVGNFRTHTITEKLYKAFRSYSDFPVMKITSPDFIPGINFSDHWSFWKEGIPALMVTDTAFLRNPQYHRSGDLPQTLDYEKMTKVLYGLKEAVTLYMNEIPE